MAIAKLMFALGAITGMAVGANATAPAPDYEAEAGQAFVNYPQESLAAGEQGAVRYRVKIGSNGRPKECEVTQSSGYERLDMATCRMLMNRARFTPVRDGRGKARRSVYNGRVVWRLS